MAPRSPGELRRKALSALHYALMVGGAALMLAAGAAAGPALTAAALLAGWVAGSFTEYAVHRFVLHGPPVTARVHARHHAAPQVEQVDPLSYLGPLVVAVAAWFALRWGTGSAILAHGVTAGLCLQYSWFRAVHRRMHRPGHRFSTGEGARFHRGHHADHGCNFGVTTPVWDRLMGSQRTAVRATGRTP